ncbi:AMP1 protein, partial [Calyptomena viridis]|nr:AMP1 protein [Calyptomena viridis]
MRMLYLLLPFILLLVHGATGSSLLPGNEKECRRSKGFCRFLRCPILSVTTGRCSRFYFCCRK